MIDTMTRFCISLNTSADLGHLAGVLNLPLRTLLISPLLDFDLRPGVARSLLAAAGVAQRAHGTPVCVCGEPLELGEREADVS